jgi:hypothetical protein
VIAYNLCYTTCLGRPAHVRAGATAADAVAAEAQHQQQGGGGNGGDAGGEGGAGAGNGGGIVPPEGVRLGVTKYAVPKGSLTPGGPMDPNGLVGV